MRNHGSGLELMETGASALVFGRHCRLFRPRALAESPLISTKTLHRKRLDMKNEMSHTRESVSGGGWQHGGERIIDRAKASGCGRRESVCGLQHLEDPFAALDNSELSRMAAIARRNRLPIGQPWSMRRAGRVLV